jgi:hypothetical protein
LDVGKTVTRKKSKYWQKRQATSITALHPSKGTEIEVHPQRDAMINGDLDKELERLPGTLAWWVQLRDTAEDAYREAMYKEHCAEEDIYSEVKASLKGRKVTETEIKMSIRLDPRMRTAFRDRMTAERRLQHLKSACEVIADKRWILQALVKSKSIEWGAKDSA